MCELILSFLKNKVDDEGSSDDVACNGRAIRMFSDMIRSSLRDEHFISGKYFIFYYIILPFSFIVCHVQCIMIMFLCLFVVGCALDLGLISSDDLRRVASGDIQEGSDEEDKLAVKICLEFVTMCCNLSTIRTDATNSATRYLFTNAKDNEFLVTYILNENRVFHQMGLLCLMNQEVSCVRFHQKSLTKVVKS